jgi:transcriptional regulator with XRE-family HTH domain
MNLAIRILRARKDKRFSQKETARIMGISRSALAQWESSICNPSLKNLIKLAEVLEVSFEWLATGLGVKHKTINNSKDTYLEQEIIKRLILLSTKKKNALLSIVSNML